MNHFFELLNKRYSGREFDQKRLVSQDEVKMLCQAARLAPSAYNDQPWHFIIFDKHKDLESYNTAFNTLDPYNKKWAFNAPLLILSIAHCRYAMNYEFNRFAEYDTGAAVFSMVLQATSIGMIVRQIGLFNDEQIKQLFELPKDFIPMTFLAVGYPSKDEKFPEKTRKPLSENFFLGSLKNPYH